MLSSGKKIADDQGKKRTEKRENEHEKEKREGGDGPDFQ